MREFIESLEELKKNSPCASRKKEPQYMWYYAGLEF